MHASSAENMERCVRWYLKKESGGRDFQIADLGSMNVNGGYRSLFGKSHTYVGYDLQAGPSVDVVLESPYSIPAPDGRFDVVISGQMLEHCPEFWRVATEIERILKPDGLAFLIAPSAGPIHRYPVDCYRFYPDAWQALADWAGLNLVHVWMDDRGPWNDLVGVFSKGKAIAPISAAPRFECPPIVDTPSPIPHAETTAGARHYLEVLADIHSLLKPEQYLEIGVRKGASLGLSRCQSIGVDPCPELPRRALDALIFECTSDDFFFFHAEDSIKEPIDLAFIDGMHLSEYVIRDFMNTEKYMNRNGLIIIDDVLPNHPVQANRDRGSRVWTGDVWRAVEVLKKFRPELNLYWLDTYPTGLLLITGLDPANRQLWTGFNPLMRELLADDFSSLLGAGVGAVAAAPPKEILDRIGVHAPTAEKLEHILERRI